MKKSYASFIYTHLGAEFQVDAKFSRGSDIPLHDSPYEADWELDEIEIIGEDGADWGCEMRDFYKVYKPHVGSPKNVSVYETVCEEAHENMEFE